MSEEIAVLNRPGPKPSRVPLHFYWILDVSGSMSIDGRMEALNQAIRNALPAMEDAVHTNVEARLFVRTLLFGNGARWAEVEPVPLEKFTWKDIDSEAAGTDMGAAFAKMAEELSSPKFPERGYPPVMVLISDGGPTDDYASALQKLMALPWAKKAVRCGILIDDDEDGRDVLKEFISSEKIPVLFAHNPDELAKYIRFVATTVVTTVSAPGSQVGKADEGDNVILPDDIKGILNVSDNPGSWIL